MFDELDMYRDEGGNIVYRAKIKAAFNNIAQEM